MEQYRKKTRASFLDYNGGDYFVTICTKNRAHYFGKIQTGQMFLSEIGEFTKLQLNSASEHCENIRILLSVVMPNHIHAIVNLTNDAGSLPMNEGNIMQRSPNPALRADPTCQRHVPTLSRYISSLKVLSPNSRNPIILISDGRRGISTTVSEATKTATGLQNILKTMWPDGMTIVSTTDEIQI